jgi:hypothetical protein
MARKQVGAAASQATHALTVGQSTLSVTVSTGSETRPAAAIVLWLGGSSQPTNMQNGDVWIH